MSPLPSLLIPIEHRRFYIVGVILLLLAAGCASEDPNIINPQPGSAKVLVRLINMVPDAKQRRLLMERGYQTAEIPYGGLTATVEAPSDSSFVEIFADGLSEFSTPDRVRFSRQSVYDIVTVGKPNGGVGFDTIVVSNANRSLTTLPVAQVRVINTLPDTLSFFDVRLGCPNGTPITSTPVAFKTATLYEEVSPGAALFSVQRIRGTTTDQLGTFECSLDQSTPYSIIVMQSADGVTPQFALVNEADFTSNAFRSLLPVSERDASMRVLNLSSSPATVTLQRTGQEIATMQPITSMGAYQPVPTCEQQSPDVISMVLADGRSALDSASLVLRGQYTVIAANNADSVKMIIVPPMPVLFDIAGMSIIRVVHASNLIGKISVSTGARNDASAANGYVSGITLSSGAQFGTVSSPVVLPPGELPITVTSGTQPTTLLDVRRESVEANRAYLLVVSETADGVPLCYLLEDSDIPGQVKPMHDASLLTFVNGSSDADNVLMTIGAVINNGKVFFRNSLATSALAGPVNIIAGGIQLITRLEESMRTLVVYTYKGDVEKFVVVTAPPLRQIPGQSDRRVINATADLDLVTISYDTLYHLYPDSSELVARDVPFGEASATHVLSRDRRGSMYVYDATTRKLLYTLPIVVGPLGNSYSFIVVGRKENGYEVIVLQEF